MGVIRYLLMKGSFVLFGLFLGEYLGLSKRQMEIVTPVILSVFHA
jgi:hypothetical protein